MTTTTTTMTTSYLYTQVFDMMPIGAVIDDIVFCVHGGIGNNCTTLAQVDAIKWANDYSRVMAESWMEIGGCSVCRRPCKVEGDLMMDLLWSDPTEDDTQKGIQLNTRRGQGAQAFSFCFWRMCTLRLCHLVERCLAVLLLRLKCLFGRLRPEYCPIIVTSRTLEARRRMDRM